MDYDTWFDYLRLLESEGDFPVIREAYEKAIAQVPPIQVGLSKRIINSSHSETHPTSDRILNLFSLNFLGKTILASLYIFMDKLCFIRRN